MPDNLSAESIRKKIRDEYLRDSTVTIVLVGTETRRRKHIDWEIHSSMYDGSVNRRSGIVVIMLPSANDNSIYAPHGWEEQRLYPNTRWMSIASKVEFERQHPYIPDRLISNIIKDDVKISIVSWDKLNDHILGSLVEMAFRDREDCKYDLSQPMRRANS
ncbi:MAG: TIR domain-containing protein [Nitrosopumilaceae archaeon]|nr:TIR domain-containing protein [Nitrosopumilaceae archaeon]